MKAFLMGDRVISWFASRAVISKEVDHAAVHRMLRFLRFSDPLSLLLMFQAILSSILEPEYQLNHTKSFDKVLFSRYIQES